MYAKRYRSIILAVAMLAAVLSSVSAPAQGVDITVRVRAEDGGAPVAGGAGGTAGHPARGHGGRRGAASGCGVVVVWLKR
ncbi:MAG TPA: hypothetical protein VEX86_17120 [Longimicrobium sp.]|nr:hypothetical protein [Longimicrobium sp.]